MTGRTIIVLDGLDHPIYCPSRCWKKSEWHSMVTVVWKCPAIGYNGIGPWNLPLKPWSWKPQIGWFLSRHIFQKFVQTVGVIKNFWKFVQMTGQASFDQYFWKFVRMTGQASFYQNFVWINQGAENTSDLVWLLKLHVLELVNALHECSPHSSSPKSQITLQCPRLSLPPVKQLHCLLNTH